MGYLKRKFDFPTRHVFVIWSFLGFTIAYTMRVNLSVAIVAMNNNSSILTEDETQSSLACRELVKFQNHTSYTEIQPRGEFNWNINTQSLVLGAFFYGYIVANIFGGIIVQKWSAKWLFGLGVFLTSILTLLSPIAARWSVPAFVAVRVLEGLAEGPMFASIATMIGRWAPKIERSRFSAVIMSGVFMGSVVGFPISGFLCKSHFLGGWPSAFYVFGVCGCVWFIIWTYLIHESPEDHPRISSSELTYITGNQIIEKKHYVPWKAIFTSFRVWALGLALFGQGWGFHTMMAEMPTYLSNILHFSIEQNGMLSALPSILQMFSSWLASYIADKLRQSGKLSNTTICKIFNSIGFFGSGLCIMLVTFVGCRPTTSMILLCTALGLNGFGYAGYKVTPIDMSPRFGGIIMGIICCVGNISGFLAPYTAGQIRKSGETIRNWNIVFGVTAGIYFITGIVYDVFCSAELQSWNTPVENSIRTNILVEESLKTTIFTNQTSKKFADKR